jgi:hypothetical protein
MAMLNKVNYLITNDQLKLNEHSHIYKHKCCLCDSVGDEQIFINL